jgi:prepilin-type N-terminal cleavage/methylation domain-containing protein
MPRHIRSGYTLIELVIALFLFTVGALGLVATSAVIGRELIVNSNRERAGRMAATRLEMLAAECRSAIGGRETIDGIESVWVVASADSSRVSLLESVRYPMRHGDRTDVYRATLPCRP